MIRRFVPPAVAAFGVGPDAELAQTLAQARDDGFAEGREVGRREGHSAGLHEGEAAATAAHQIEFAALQEMFAKHQATLAVTTALEQVLDARSADRQTLEDTTRIGIVAVLRMLFPTLLEQTAGQEIAALLTEALTDRAPETLTLRAHPDTLRAVAEPDPTRGHAARLTMQPDATLPFGTAEIAWVGGGLTLDPAALHARVRHYPCPQRKGTSHMSDVIPPTIAEDRLASVMDIPVTLTVVLGEREISLGKLYALGRGAVIELDKRVGEPVDIFVNDRLVARGEMQLGEDGRLAVSMTELASAGTT